MRANTMMMFMFCATVFASIGYFVVTGQSPAKVLGRINDAFQPSRVRVLPEDFGPLRQAPKGVEAVRKVNPRPAVAKAAVAAALEPAVVEAPPPLAPKKPMPSIADHLVGMTKSELLERFCTPSLQLSSTKNGDVFESVLYNVKDSPKPTTLELKNGIVINVQMANTLSANSQ